MNAVYELCDGTDTRLNCPSVITLPPPKKGAFTEAGRAAKPVALHGEGYFDLITSERKGERMYVITLKESGYAFRRSQKQRRRDIWFKIALAFVGALAPFIFGLILRSIFGQ